MTAPEREALVKRLSDAAENELLGIGDAWALLAEAAEALSAPAVTVTEGWQTMNSAPYDKTTVALIALRSDGSWKTGTGWYMPLTGWQGFDESPTHWAPLPKFDPAALKSTTPQTGSQE